MSEQAMDATIHIESTPQMENIFPIEREYARCVTTLNRTGLLSILPKSESIGVSGIDGKEYPLPTPENMEEVFDFNKELVKRKASQGFTRLALTPMAMPISLLMDRMKSALLKHAAEGRIYQTRRTPTDLLAPVRVNQNAPIWIWDTLRQAVDTDEMVYFPTQFSSDPEGQTKEEVVENGLICAVPGWSIGLVEDLPIMPQKGMGKALNDRKQLETDMTSRDYLRILQTPEYQGETGQTLEDFITKFVTHLEATNEVSNDWYDNNALFLIGQFLKSGSVPYGRWNRA